MAAATLAIELLLMNIIGIFIRKSGVTNKDFTTKLTAVVMDFCIPCLIFYSISNATEFSMDSLSSCLIAAALGTIALFISLLVGQCFYLISKKSNSGRITRYGLTFCHFSFMGIPVIEALFGELGTFYYAFFQFSIRIAYYALSERLMTPLGMKNEKKSIGVLLKSIFFTPQMFAVILGLLFWITGWTLPGPINNCVYSLNSISSPLALLLCGMVIAEFDFKRLLRLEYLKLPLLRTVLMPALFFGISRLLLLLNIDEILCQIFVIYAALPVASLMSVYALRYDPDPENHLMAAGTSAISVLLSAVTIPIWYMLIS